MSYLNLPAGIPDFGKAVISLWFRVPKASAIKTAGRDPLGDFPLMQKVMPLVTFGAAQKLKIYERPRHNVGTIIPYLPGEPHAGTTFMRDYYVEGASYDVDPGMIGILCQEDGTFSLVFNLQTADRMTLTGAAFITTHGNIYSGSDPSAPVYEAGTPGTGVVSEFPNVVRTTIEEASYTYLGQPEFFYVQSEKTLEPDQWHHLLLSFDIGGSVSIGTPFASSACRLWYAIDDADYRGAENMQPYRELGGQWGPDTLDPNAIITRTAWRLSGSDPNWEAIHYYDNHYVGLPVGELDGTSIPNGAFGIPASIGYVDYICQCEMAEFQMWVGVTLDTGIESNRRAFLDYKRDEDGNPISGKLEPVKPEVAEALLGKRPELLLHKTSKWQKGENTGSLGTERNTAGEEVGIPAGQFAPTGDIDKYKPDPSIIPAS